ncbi:response regulator transcription factor [bacterium]|jgi:two-component system response regulator MprA|nr:response regulator transcription factor [bacterium]
MRAHETRDVRILAVDDNRDILSVLQRGLQRRGYEVIACGDGETALRAFAREKPDLVILDLLLPDADGIDLCYEMQEASEVPVIMLTSRDELSDRVEGLRAGADDYVVKPFAMEELVARIEAVLRRRPATPDVISYDDLDIDIDGHLVRRGGHEIALTPKEFALLETMARHPNRVFTRESLAATLWPDSDSVDDNLLDVHATNLRQKLEAGGGRRLIQTVRGIGFVLR